MNDEIKISLDSSNLVINSKPIVTMFNYITSGEQRIEIPTSYDLSNVPPVLHEFIIRMIYQQGFNLVFG